MRLGTGVDLLRRAELLDPSLVHHDHAVGQGERLALIVRDVEEGEAEPLLQALHLALHADAQVGVERAQGLVEQQDLRFGDQRAGNGDPLLLAAGELAHPAIEELAELHQFGDLADLGLDRGLVVTAERQAEGDVLANVEMREQREVLPHQPGGALVHRQRRDVLAAQQKTAARHRFQAGDDAQKRGLAAAARPHDGDELAALDGKIDGFEGDEVAEALGDAAQLEIDLRRGDVGDGIHAHTGASREPAGVVGDTRRPAAVSPCWS